MSENIKKIVEYNKKFVEDKKYEEFLTTKYPNKKTLILSCMDTRLTELLPAALGIKNGDVKIIKNAGGIISHPFGSVMRSILVAVYELGVTDVLVIGHYDCGVKNMDSKKIFEKISERGIQDEVVNTIINSGFDLEKWFTGFDSIEKSVKETVQIIEKHPLMPKEINIYGFAMSPETGQLDKVE